jgi:hypothetical protein
LKRLTISLLALICTGALFASSALGGQSTEPTTPTLTLKQANHYAKKGTTAIFSGNYGLPKHLTYGSHHIEEVITYALQSVDRCKRGGMPSRSFFRCTVHASSTVYTGGEYPKEEVVEFTRPERVAVEPLSTHVPKQQPETEARFPFRKGFRIVVAF